MNSGIRIAMLLAAAAVLVNGGCTEQKRTDTETPAQVPAEAQAPIPAEATVPDQSTEELVWLTDFEAAKQKAAATKRPILADFSGSDWCGWCIKLDKEVFSEAAFQAYAEENLVLFLADFPSRKKLPEDTQKQNQELADKYGIRGFPTVLILDAEGTVLAKTGYQRGGAEAYVSHLKELTGGTSKNESTAEEAGAQQGDT